MFINAMRVALFQGADVAKLASNDGLICGKHQDSHVGLVAF
jgi:hypothetical protein